MLTKKFIIDGISFSCKKPNATQLVKYSREVAEALRVNDNNFIAKVKVDAAFELITKVEFNDEKIEVNEKLKEDYSAELFILANSLLDKCFVSIEAENPLAEK